MADAFTHDEYFAMTGFFRVGRNKLTADEESKLLPAPGRGPLPPGHRLALNQKTGYLELWITSLPWERHRSHRDRGQQTYRASHQEPRVWLPGPSPKVSRGIRFDS